MRRVGQSELQFPGHRRGFSLVELMVTISIVVILALVGVPSFQQIIATTRVKGVSSDLFVALTKARSTAVKRDAPVTITPKSGGWVNGWQITDNNGAVLVDADGRDGVLVTGGPASIVFLSNGRIRPTITLPLSFSVSSAVVADLGRCITANASGRPYVKAQTC